MFIIETEIHVLLFIVIWKLSQPLEKIPVNYSFPTSLVVEELFSASWICSITIWEACHFFLCGFSHFFFENHCVLPTIVIQFRQITSVNCSRSYSSNLTISIFYSISSLTVLSFSLCSHQRYPFCVTVWTDPIPIFSLTEIWRTQENGAHQGLGNGLSIFSRNWMLPSC